MRNETNMVKVKWQHDCHACPLSNLRLRNHSQEETTFIASFKIGEMTAQKGAILVRQGARSPHLYTVLDGMAYRYKTLDDDRRQILGYAMPGDFIGLQAAVLDEMQHTVEALSAMQLCVFDRSRLFELFKEQPSLSFALTWLAATDEKLVDEHLTSLGRRSAYERIAFFMLYLFERARLSRLTDGDKLHLPITQMQLADTLGLSLVHINKTLKRLKRDGLMAFQNHVLHILDPEAMKEVSFWNDGLIEDRPYL